VDRDPLREEILQRLGDAVGSNEYRDFGGSVERIATADLAGGIRAPERMDKRERRRAACGNDDAVDLPASQRDFAGAHDGFGERGSEEPDIDCLLRPE
jgi:hypothetical protein